MSETTSQDVKEVSWLDFTIDAIKNSVERTDSEKCEAIHAVLLASSERQEAPDETIAAKVR